LVKINHEASANATTQ